MSHHLPRPATHLRGAGSRTARRLLLGRGPLKRGTDRVEMVSRLLLALVVAAAVPVALLFASTARHQALEEAAAQAADRHQATAVLVEDTTGTLGSAGDRQYVRARWTTPDGSAAEGRVAAPVGATAGQGVTVWLDARGGLTEPPLSRSDVADRSMVRGALAFLVLTGAGLAGHGAVCLALARRRARQWDEGWAVVEPQWAGRHRQA